MANNPDKADALDPLPPSEKERAKGKDSRAIKKMCNKNPYLLQGGYKVDYSAFKQPKKAALLETPKSPSSGTGVASRLGRILGFSPKNAAGKEKNVSPNRDSAGEKKVYEMRQAKRKLKNTPLAKTPQIKTPQMRQVRGKMFPLT